MGSTKDLSVPLTSGNISGVIEAGCEFEGKLCFHGVLRIAGQFKGEIYTPDTLIIGEGARVQAQIDAGVVIISGEVIGDVKAKHRVEIHHPAVFKGNIQTPSLRVDEGVVFEGSSKMSQSTKSPGLSQVPSIQNKS